jgi:hypothetical protein
VRRRAPPRPPLSSPSGRVAGLKSCGSPVVGGRWCCFCRFVLLVKCVCALAVQRARGLPTRPYRADGSVHARPAQVLGADERNLHPIQRSEGNIQPVEWG